MYIEMFDFKENKWSNAASLNHRREKCGIYYERFSQNIGGGWGGENKTATNCVEYYDIHKNKWIEIASRQRENIYIFQ